MHARTLRYHANVSRQFATVWRIDLQTHLITNSSHPSEIGALTRNQILCFRAKLRGEIMYTPVHPSFSIQKWSLMGSKLHGCVILMDESSQQFELFYMQTGK